MGMTAAELGDRMSAAEFERRLALERIRVQEREDAQQE
jgi:hypothetical protein